MTWQWRPTTHRKGGSPAKPPTRYGVEQTKNPPEIDVEKVLRGIFK